MNPTLKELSLSVRNEPMKDRVDREDRCNAIADALHAHVMIHENLVHALKAFLEMPLVQISPDIISCPRNIMELKDAARSALAL